MNKKRGIFDKSVTRYYEPIYPPTTWQPLLPPVNYDLRETPVARADTLEAGVWVPALQAVFVGMAWGAVAGIGAGMIGAVWLNAPWWVIPLVGAATWASVTAWHLTSGIRLRQSLLWKREELERRDLDGDGHIGEPVTTVRVEIDEPEASRTQFLNLDVDPERVSLFARSVLGGRGLGVAEWTGKGGIFSRSEYERLRGILLERGLLKWANAKDKRQGIELTRAGRAVFSRLVNLSPTIEG